MFRIDGNKFGNNAHVIDDSLQDLNNFIMDDIFFVLRNLLDRLRFWDFNLLFGKLWLRLGLDLNLELILDLNLRLGLLTCLELFIVWDGLRYLLRLFCVWLLGFRLLGDGLMSCDLFGLGDWIVEWFGILYVWSMLLLINGIA